MASGLIALLDDVAGIAKVAAASVDDAISQSARAGVKAVGLVIDDAAVTPRYVTGFSPSRELPIVGKIALGSLRNKLLFLLPGALALSTLAPWVINPLLMLGGAYLCFEGAEKVYEALWPHASHAAPVVVEGSAKRLEDAKVSGAIKTDLILSAEIMAVTLATVPDSPFVTQAVVLAVVGIGITGLVYGGVALIVKADDAGLALARGGNPVLRSIGRGLVTGMPWFLKVLSVVGTAAMVWVGGGILIHGLEPYGWTTLPHAVHDASVAAGRAVPAVAGLVEWAVAAAASGVVGLLVGAALIPLVTHVIGPAMRRIRG